MARRRERVARSLQRAVGVRPLRKTLLVFCEGARTEPEYLTGLSRLREVRDVAAVDIRIDRDSAGFARLISSVEPRSVAGSTA